MSAAQLLLRTLFVCNTTFAQQIRTLNQEMITAGNVLSHLKGHLFSVRSVLLSELLLLSGEKQEKRVVVLTT